MRINKKIVIYAEICAYMTIFFMVSDSLLLFLL